jgi:isoleucyl-tRNA synthetase
VQGELRDYVCSELNIRVLETCSDPLQYCTLRAEPEHQALGKRLGKNMGPVSAAIKALQSHEILQYESKGEIEVLGHKMGPGDIKVRSSFIGSEP